MKFGEDGAENEDTGEVISGNEANGSWESLKRSCHSRFSWLLGGTICKYQ